ncbi:MAG: folate-binding protein YgfZ [Hyphomicrobiales bacterium]|nr:folate-binding protein YgfZ [Hyphomicrobiales bacterium]MCP5000700.1 folate-binding protein YgfZ [Hyphomicrobiales bacterium]
MKFLALEYRALVAIGGEDAQSLLQDVISCGVEDLPDGMARPGALLTPQGKIMFAFLLSRDGTNRFLFDMTRGRTTAFMQRMTMYRLRAKADIELVEDQMVHAAWDCEREPGFLRDDRFRDNATVFRFYGQFRTETASLAEYNSLRVTNGVAEAEVDYALSDVFPHDVLMDLNGGISFKKGCFVGQEVVSRMQHRGTARKRVVILSADAPLPASGTALTSAGRTIGTIGTVTGTKALALARTDRISAAVAANELLMAGDIPVTAILPAWTGLEMPVVDAAKES